MQKILLIIDVQNGFINKHTKHLPKIIDNFILSNQKRFSQILFSQFVNLKSSNWVKLYDWEKMQTSPEIDIVPELQKYLLSDNSFSKNGFSCFRSLKFTDSLKNKNIELYICGVDTDACVYCTTMEAFESGFSVKVISDLCTASHGSEFHKSALKLLKRNLGDKILIKSKAFN